MIALDLLVIVPVVLAAVAALAARAYTEAARWVALVGVLAQAGLLLSLQPLGVFDGQAIQGVSLSGGGAAWHTMTDGLSTPLLALTVFVGLMAISASWRLADKTGAHYALLLILQGAMAGVFLADTLVMLYVAWESVLIPMFLLIAGWGSSNARKASMKFLVYTFAGGAVLLAALVYLGVVAQDISISGILESGVTGADETLLFWLLAIAFLIKVPAVPLHTWLPDAHTEAPTAGSIVLAGVLLKMGGYGLMRIALPLAPAGFDAARPVLIALGVIGIIWGAMTALVQSDLKRLVAYSSVAHMGFVLVAIGVASAASLSAAMLTMVSHGVVAALLFYLVGAMYSRTHTRELSRMGGFGTVSPRWSVAFVFASLASAGLPGLSGFPGEFITMLESFGSIGWWVLVAGFGVVLAAAYNLRAVRKTVQGPLGEVGAFADLDSRETLTVVTFAVATVALGVAPWLVSDMSSAAMRALSILANGGA